MTRLQTVMADDEEKEESERRSGRSVGSNEERTKESLGEGGGRVVGSAGELKCRTVVSRTHRQTK
jgi:hypothetical protein